jgi:sugar phosphate permease
MPVVFVTYSLAYLGRSNFGFRRGGRSGRIAHITESRAAFLGSVFFLGYFLFQVPPHPTRSARAPRGWSSSRSSVGACSPRLPASFGIIGCSLLDRLLLGVAESLIFPSMLILLTNWFTRTERSRANAILMIGNPVTVTWMAAVTGFLIKAVGWQTTFIIEGIPSILWAFVWVLVARDRPRDVGLAEQGKQRATCYGTGAGANRASATRESSSALRVPA